MTMTITITKTIDIDIDHILDWIEEGRFYNIEGAVNFYIGALDDDEYYLIDEETRHDIMVEATRRWTERISK